MPFQRLARISPQTVNYGSHKYSHFACHKKQQYLTANHFTFPKLTRSDNTQGSILLKMVLNLLKFHVYKTKQKIWILISQDVRAHNLLTYVPKIWNSSARQSRVLTLISSIPSMYLIRLLRFTAWQVQLRLVKVAKRKLVIIHSCHVPRVC